jgi:hypothetical protein
MKVARLSLEANGLMALTYTIGDTGVWITAILYLAGFIVPMLGLLYPRQKVQLKDRPYQAKVLLNWGQIPLPGRQAHRKIEDHPYIIHNPAGLACEVWWDYEFQEWRYVHSGELGWFDCDVLIDKDQITILDAKRVMPPRPDIL